MKHKPTREAVEAIINAYNLIKDFACPINVIDNVYNLLEPSDDSCDEVIE